MVDKTESKGGCYFRDSTAGSYSTIMETSLSITGHHFVISNESVNNLGCDLYRFELMRCRLFVRDYIES